MRRTLLLVDLSYQTYRASAAHPMLTSRRIFTGGLYGFFTTVAKMIRDTRATEAVFCQDVRPYERSNTYPEYKQFRKKNADEELLKMYKQSMSLVLDALHAAGLPVWGIKGFEVDDIVAHVAARYRHRYETIWAGTNDSDIYQMLWVENFKVYRKSLADVMDHREFARKYNMTTEQFILASALQGTHNDIEGIHGVGEVTALKIAKDPALLRAYREKHQALIDRNMGLIRLPHPLFPADAALPKVGDFSARSLFRNLNQYDIDVTASIDQAFRQIGETR